MKKSVTDLKKVYQFLEKKIKETENASVLILAERHRVEQKLRRVKELSQTLLPGDHYLAKSIVVSQKRYEERHHSAGLQLERVNAEHAKVKRQIKFLDKKIRDLDRIDEERRFSEELESLVIRKK